MNFAKVDENFTCEKCKKKVGKLGYTSRNHCPFCLHSLHVDIVPGDRANPCKGLLVPVGVLPDNKKGYIIEFVCARCMKHVRNKTAKDDDFEQLLKLGDKR